ncbi:MAG TPA: hypothetical protein VFK20_10640 [Vicinamibacterales bacterium]|nr:hypothetical protein [Vicinamibacterales bacterium]
MHRPEPLDALIALALDLLAHTEAQYRQARRLDGATQILARVADEQTETRQAANIREVLDALRELSDVQRSLVDDFQQRFDGWSRSDT